MEAPRAVMHLDLDCFYCAVEHRRLGIPREKPLAVQQWNGLIAINYAARALGLGRFSKADEVRSKFPEIELVHVEVIERQDSAEKVSGAAEVRRDETKVSLRRYREASFQVMAVICKFVPPQFVERASIDEVYIDATTLLEEEEREIADLDLNGLGQYLYSEDIGCNTNIIGHIGKEDRLLVAGAKLMSKIRKAIFEETSFTISGGMATNKLLAKIASAQNKPNKQTLVPRAFGCKMARTLSISKVPSLGGKFGKSVSELFKTYVKEGEEKLTLEDVVQKIPYQALVEKLGPEGAGSIIKLSNGQCDRPVVPKMAPKSLLSAKSFKGTDNIQILENWLQLLARELFDRVRTDAVMFGRIPTKMTLSIAQTGRFGGRTKRMNVPKPNRFLAYVLAVQKDIAENKQSGEPESIIESGAEEIVRSCMTELQPVVWTIRLSLQLDTFESTNIPGSWAGTHQKTQTQQQATFASFFSAGTTSKSPSETKKDHEEREIQPLKLTSEKAVRITTPQEDTPSPGQQGKYPKKVGAIRSFFQSTTKKGISEKGCFDEDCEGRAKRPRSPFNHQEKQDDRSKHREKDGHTNLERSSEGLVKVDNKTPMPTSRTSETLQSLEKKVASNAFNLMLLSSMEKGFKRGNKSQKRR